MVDPVMSCLSTISPSLASVECLKVHLGWDPVSNKDVGWLTVLGEIGEGNMTAMAETGLVFREWNMEMGPYTGKGRLEKLEKLLHAVLETMPSRYLVGQYFSPNLIFAYGEAVINGTPAIFLFRILKLNQWYAVHTGKCAGSAGGFFWLGTAPRTWT